MQIRERNGAELRVDPQEPHVYRTENELSVFLRQHLVNEKREHLLIFTGAEEKILAEQMARKPHVAREPLQYLDNIVLSLLRADGLPVRACPKEGCVAIVCNFPW